MLTFFSSGNVLRMMTQRVPLVAVKMRLGNPSLYKRGSKPIFKRKINKNCGYQNFEYNLFKTYNTTIVNII